jgi:predicted DNA-binding transcriptional regulator YafY
MTLQEIADALSVTTRSARRYLREVAREYEIEKVAAGSRAPLWRLRPEERPRKVGLRRAQSYAFLATRGLFECMRGSALYDEIDLALRTVLTLANRPGRGPNAGVVDARLEKRFVHLPAAPLDYTPRSEELDVLYHAVAELRPVYCRHRPPFEAASDIVLHPYAMVLYRDAIYAVGVAEGNPHVKVFPLHELYDARLSTTTQFAVPPDFDLDTFYQGTFGLCRGEGKVRVVVDFDAQGAQEVRLRRLHPSQKVSSLRGGGMRLTMSMSDTREVARWVLSFGTRARVVEPEALRDQVLRELRGALSLYRDRAAPPLT